MNIEEFKTELEKVRVWYDTLTDFDLYKPWLLYNKDELFVALAYIVSDTETIKNYHSKNKNLDNIFRNNKKNSKLYDKFHTFKSSRSNEDRGLSPLEWVNLILYKYDIICIKLPSVDTTLIKKQSLSYKNGYIYNPCNNSIYIENKQPIIQISPNLKVLSINNDFLLLDMNEGIFEYWPHETATISAYKTRFPELRKTTMDYILSQIQTTRFQKLLRTFNKDPIASIKSIFHMHYTELSGYTDDEIIPLLYDTLACYTDKKTLDTAFEQYQLTKSIKHIELILTEEIHNLTVNYEPTDFDLI